MRLHSNKLTTSDIYSAMDAAKVSGNVAHHIHFSVFTDHRSRTRNKAWEIQLGTYHKLPGDKRGWKNTGQYGADSVGNGQGLYAATYDEWGYFIAELYKLDPELVFGHYKSLETFQRVTENKYAA